MVRIMIAAALATRSTLTFVTQAPVGTLYSNVVTLIESPYRNRYN